MRRANPDLTLPSSGELREAMRERLREQDQIIRELNESHDRDIARMTLIIRHHSLMIRELADVLEEYMPLTIPAIGVMGASNQALYARAVAALEKAKQS